MSWAFGDTQLVSEALKRTDAMQIHNLECLAGRRHMYPGPPARCLSHPLFGWECSPAKIDVLKKKSGTLILTSLEDLVSFNICGASFRGIFGPVP